MIKEIICSGTKGSSLLKGRKLTRHWNKQQISNMIKGTKKQHTKKPHSKLTVNDEILKTHLLQLKTRQKHWLFNSSKSPSQHKEPKWREQSSLLHNAENPEHIQNVLNGHRGCFSIILRLLKPLSPFIDSDEILETSQGWESISKIASPHPLESELLVKK